MKLIITPAAGKIAVLEDSFKYTGKVIIPQKAERRPTTGTIVAIGRGVGYYGDDETDSETGEPIHVFHPYYVLNDRVVYGIYSGTVINIKGEPAYRILGMEEILCKIETDETFELEGVGT